jgi:hypothetical protein
MERKLKETHDEREMMDLDYQQLARNPQVLQEWISHFAFGLDERAAARACWRGTETEAGTGDGNGLPGIDANFSTGAAVGAGDGKGLAGNVAGFSTGLALHRVGGHQL